MYFRKKIVYLFNIILNVKFIYFKYIFLYEEKLCYKIKNVKCCLIKKNMLYNVGCLEVIIDIVFLVFENECVEFKVKIWGFFKWYGVIWMKDN